MSREFTVIVAGTGDLATIQQLAEEIWPVTYGEILEPDQLRYMLDYIYNLPTLNDQLVNQQHVFLIAKLDKEDIGFASYSLIRSPGIFKLHKIYIHPKTQGLGLGKALLNHIIESIRVQHATTLRLNVNRYNKAKQFYEKLGFTVTGEEDVDLGNNVFMEDYIMELAIHSPSP